MQTKLKEPKLCEDRGRFFVWLEGKRHYLSAKGRKDAEVKRKQFLANLWLGNAPVPSGTGRSSPPVQKNGGSLPLGVETDDMLIAELGDEFLEYHTPPTETAGTIWKNAIRRKVNFWKNCVCVPVIPRKHWKRRDIDNWDALKHHENETIPSHLYPETLGYSSPFFRHSLLPFSLCHTLRSCRSRVLIVLRNHSYIRNSMTTKNSLMGLDKMKVCDTLCSFLHG